MTRSQALADMLDRMLEEIAKDNRQRCESALRECIELWVQEDPRRARDELAAFRFCERLKNTARFYLH